MKVLYVLGIFSQGKLVTAMTEARLESTWFNDMFFEFLATKCENLQVPEGTYIAWDKYQ